MPTSLACERLPVELWLRVIAYALAFPSTVMGMLEDQTTTSNQITYERAFRSFTTTEERLEITRREGARCRLRAVCASWKSHVDTSYGAWMDITDVDGKGTIARPSFKTSNAARIDIHPISNHLPVDGSVNQADRELAKPAQERFCARILTLNTPFTSIDTFLHRHGSSFPELQVLDLRPASSFLTPKGGVTAGPAFFPTLSVLFPLLSILLVDLPPSGIPDILAFPKLRRLSYNVTGQSRLSDWQRCTRMTDWELPMLEHVSLNPVGCQHDWELVVAALEVWGRHLQTLCWAAEYPDAAGIKIREEDWETCPALKEIDCDKGTNTREVAYTSQRPTEQAKKMPAEHPFLAISPAGST